MGQFKDITIKNVIEELNQSYFLPDIQREYVWLNKANEKKIEQLFDSILRNYPFGSFLFWKLKKSDIETNRDVREVSDKLNFQLYKFIEKYDIRDTHNEKIDIEQVNSNDLSIVLDGQQRLTSLYIGLKGSRTLKKPKAWWDNPTAFEEKRLYINLRYQPTEENPDDNYQFEFLNPSNMPGVDENNFWFKVGDILCVESLLGYAREKGLSDKEMFILEKLRNAFCTQNLISYFEETEKNLDKVLKIFIRVNSGGTQLSYSDLLMSILTANFSSDIRDLMNKLVDNLAEKGFAVMGRDQILKTSLLLTGCNHIFQLKSFSKGNIHKVEDNWTEITDSIYDAIHLMQDFGYARQLSSGYIISVLAFYLFKKGIKYNQIQQEDREEMWKFVRNAQITSFFTTSLDTKLSYVSNVMRGANTFKEFNEKMYDNRYLRITPEDVEQMMALEYGNPAILPLLQLLYPNLDYKNSIFHIDHIYPKSKFVPKNEKLPVTSREKKNCLFNLQLLEGRENNIKRTKDPETWLEENYSAEEIVEYKLKNYIPGNLKLEWENILQFEEARNKMISTKLREVFK